MHFKEVCKGCGVLLSQCRCPGPKETREGLCGSCRAAGITLIPNTPPLASFAGASSAQARAILRPALGRRRMVEALEYLAAAEPWIREIEMQALRAHDPAFSAAVLELGKIVRSAHASASAAMGDWVPGGLVQKGG